MKQTTHLRSVKSNLSVISYQFVRILMFVLLVITGLSFRPALGITAADFQAGLFTSAKYPKPIPYRWLPPLKVDANTRYPMVMWLHANGSQGTDNIKHVEGKAWADLIASPANRAKYPGYIIAPQCPPGDRWPWVVGELVDLLKEFSSQQSVDTNRLYVCGLCMGGWGTCVCVINVPHFFAAGIPIAGNGTPGDSDWTTALRDKAAWQLQYKTVPDCNLSMLKTMPLWVFHGGADPTVEVSHSRTRVSALRTLKATPIYTEYPSADHGGGLDLSIIEKDLLPWLYSQNKAGGNAPTAPQNLKVTVNQGHADLTWTAPTSPTDGLLCYIVYKDGKRLSTTLADLSPLDGSGMSKLLRTTSFTDSAFISREDSLFTVTAVNYRGQESAPASYHFYPTGITARRIHP